MKKRLIAAYEGSLAADALSMPVHWYYDTQALEREYGFVDHFMAPKNPHTGSILFRSKYEPINDRGDILREQAKYWGREGIHYHQFLKAGENTLNFKLARELHSLVIELRGYDADTWLERYIACMLQPGWHNDTYVEEYHREFFKNYARGRKPRKCGIKDIHIGGLATVPALIAALVQVEDQISVLRLQQTVRQHVSLTHLDPEVLDAAETLTRLLYAIANGETLKMALRHQAHDWFSEKDADAWLGEADTRIVGVRFSPACYIKDSMPGALHLAWKYHDDFARGIIANTMVGGENCHRGAVVGSLLAAAQGEVPLKFRTVVVHP